jgi:hypothetical protein
MVPMDARDSVSYPGPGQPVPAELFGMHIHRAAAGTAWPPIPFADWRLWDARVSWPQLEPERGRWDFALLDRYLNIAAQHHVEILLTLGLTPAWASARRGEHSAYGPGNAAEPRQLADWENYVRTVSSRYKGEVDSYEIWNEPNEKGTYTGNVPEMLALSRTAYRSLKSIDPNITVVSPSATAETGLPWLKEFLKEGGCQYADVIGYHFYVTPKAPEAMVGLIRRVQEILHQHNCEKPLWNTESGWAEPKHFRSNEQAAGYVLRTYILNWLLGVQRCYWYAWDNHNWSTLDLTSPSDNRMTSVGEAYDLVHRWLIGGTLRSCLRDDIGIWICALQRSGLTQKLIWSETGDQTFTVPASWNVRSMSNWQNQTKPVPSRLTIGEAPLLLSDK